MPNSGNQATLLPKSGNSLEDKVIISNNVGIRQPNFSEQEKNATVIRTNQSGTNLVALIGPDNC